MKKIKLSDVIKKDLRVLSYLIVFGGVTILSKRYLEAGDLSVLLGAAANYILYRIRTELEGEGYKRAIEAK
jgi:hypothetical protein